MIEGITVKASVYFQQSDGQTKQPTGETGGNLGNTHTQKELVHPDLSLDLMTEHTVTRLLLF